MWLVEGKAAVNINFLWIDLKIINSSTNVERYKRPDGTNIGRYKRLDGTNIGRYKRRTAAQTSDLQTSDWYKPSNCNKRRTSTDIETVQTFDGCLVHL